MLRECLESCNHQIEYAAVLKVIATYAGEPDMRDWRWIVLLGNEKFAFIRGGCTIEDGTPDDWHVASLQFASVADALRAAMGVKGLSLVASLIINDFQDDDETLDVLRTLKTQVLTYLQQSCVEKARVEDVAQAVA